jgi:hypothetical protein
MKSKTAQGVSSVSLTGCFPKALMKDVKKLVVQGEEMKKRGHIAAYKAHSRGPAAIPILKVKRWNGLQEQGKWETSG